MVSSEGMITERSQIADPVRDLLDEHVVFLGALEQLVDVTARIDRNQASIAPPVMLTMQELWSAVDKHLNVHFLKEEEIFFPAIERLFPSARVKFQFLHVDHDRLREEFDRFTELLLWARHAHVKPSTIDELRRVAREMVRLFYYHIVAEDVVYLDVASTMLSPEESASLGERMRTLEERLRERMG